MKNNNNVKNKKENGKKINLKNLKKDFTVFYKEGCPYSINAINELKELGYEYKKIILNKDFSQKEFVETFAPDCTYPRVFHGKTFIGGNDDLMEYLKTLEIEN